MEELPDRSEQRVRTEQFEQTELMAKETPLLNCIVEELDRYIHRNKQLQQVLQKLKKLIINTIVRVGSQL